MDVEFIAASFINLMVNLSYVIISLVVAVYALVIVDKKLLKDVNIQQELKQNNIAVAIFASTLVIFVALIICFGLNS